MERSLEPDEKAFLLKKYSEYSEDEIEDFIQKLTYIHTGEMVPYYAMRYGFYEGHTDFRADPIAISFIFGLKNIREIDHACSGDMYNILHKNYTK